MHSTRVVYENIHTYTCTCMLECLVHKSIHIYVHTYVCTFTVIKHTFIGTHTVHNYMHVHTYNVAYKEHRYCMYAHVHFFSVVNSYAIETQTSSSLSIMAGISFSSDHKCTFSQHLRTTAVHR